MTVNKLAASGAKMVIISNSSRRASITMEKMKSLGFDPSLFVGAITSGELTYQCLQRLLFLSFACSDGIYLVHLDFCAFTATEEPF